MLAVDSLLMKLPCLAQENHGSLQLVPLCREACSRTDNHILASLENGSRLTKLFFSNISETRNYLQTLGLLGETLEHDEVARFLRHCPGLSKQTIGDLLGENDQFFLDVLDAFTGTFSFRGAHPPTMMSSGHQCY